MKYIVLLMASLSLFLTLSQATPAMGSSDCRNHVPVKRTYSKAEIVSIAEKAAFDLKIKLSAADKLAVWRIVHRESRGYTGARNKSSSAYGLGGFLNSTWRGTGVKKSDCATCQVKAMLRYIKGRYGTPSKAYRFHQSRRWY